MIKMTHGTKIEWTHIPGYKGETWNPVTGCTKISDGCTHCYAEDVANRFWGDRKFTDVEVHEDRLDIPLRWKKPRAIFVNSMSDLFHENIPHSFIEKIWARMIVCDRHLFIILTKRPERMREFIDGQYWVRVANMVVKMEPNAAKRALLRKKAGQLIFKNVWLGVSVEDQDTADERIPVLLQCPAALRFVSYEPALGRVGFIGMPGVKGFWDGHSIDPLRGVAVTKYPLSVDPSPPEKTEKIDWVICGGESGPQARPMHPDWARYVRDQCQAAGVPFFFKQWGAWGFHSKGPGVHSALCGKKIHKFEDGTKCGRVGKKAAGHLLDHRQHHEFPLSCANL